MMNPHQQLAIRALERMMGDDLQRIRACFRNYTEEQMQREYGQSGMTCAQILREAEVADATVADAINWVKGAK